MGRTVRLGSGSAYWGDLLEPAVTLAARGDLDYLCFDHLAELTLAILQRHRVKDPERGYVGDIVAWMDAILPLARASGTRLVTNAGGANPPAAARQVVEVARRHGLDGTRVGVVTGDDVLERMLALAGEGVAFPNLDTGEASFDSVRDRIVAANAYIGAEGIVTSLAAGADVVVTGRVSDNALYVGPLMHEFGWTYDDHQLVGAAVTIGHMVECAALMTGSLSNFWAETGDIADIGFPIAEVDDAGDAEFTKVGGTGGLVTEQTLAEQLVYEVHDPARYLMPDGVADFTKPTITQVGPDRVRMTGMTGSARPDTPGVRRLRRRLDRGGTAMFSWPDAHAKARQGEEVVRRRLKICGVEPDALHVEYLGVNTLHGPAAPPPAGELNEVGLRISLRTAPPARRPTRCAGRSCIWTLGGVGSAIATPSRPREVISLWPTLIPRATPSTCAPTWSRPDVLDRRVDDGVLVLRLDDPERRNALGYAEVCELVAALRDADADPGVRCVLLTGSGAASPPGATCASSAPSWTPRRWSTGTAGVGRRSCSPSCRGCGSRSWRPSTAPPSPEAAGSSRSPTSPWPPPTRRSG